MKEISLLERQQKNSADIFSKLAFQPWLCVNEMPYRFISLVSCTRESTQSVYSVRMAINSMQGRRYNHYSVCIYMQMSLYDSIGYIFNAEHSIKDLKA